MDFSVRSYQKELLDGNGIAFEDIRRNMSELNTINTLLGGHAVTLAGFRSLAGKRNNLSVCEAGCGGGDNLLAIHRWCENHEVKVKLYGIDHNADCIAIARKQLPGDAELFTCDYKLANFRESQPDIIFSSLFCHHFTNEELLPMLRWMQANSRLGFFINDLHRHPLAYYSIRWLTRFFSKSFLVKNDAPLSVRRGFTREDWTLLMTEARIDDYAIRWRWAFRWLITSSIQTPAS